MKLTTIGNIYIAFGIIAVIEIVSSILFQRISLNLMALMLPVGIGLRSGRKSSINCAYLISWVAIAVSLLMAVISIIGQVKPLDLSEQLKMGIRILGFIVSIMVGILFYYIKNRLVYFKSANK